MTSSSVKLLIGLQIFLCFSSVFAKEIILPSDHLHQVDDCTRCHSTGIDISKIVQDKSCLTCHDQKTLDNFVAKLASGDFSIRHQTKNPHHTAGADINAAAFYDETKFGEDHNPMITIPAGKFVMGTNNRLSDEGPQHEVTLPAYQIDKFEVTNLQYKKFINATKRKSPSHFRNRTYPRGKVDHPVVYVNWNDAKDYCEWAGKRLPTDQEWEKAARGTDGRTYPWGDEFDIAKANMPLRWESFGRKFGDTLPIGSFPSGVSPFGLHDMTGNVWEWTESWYYAYPNVEVKSENYGERYKTLKGGSWFDCSFYKCGISAPVFNRAFFGKKTKNDTFGFRCAKDI